MIIKSDGPDALLLAVRRAVHYTLTGTKRDACSTGRLLISIPPETSDAELTEVETVLARADAKFWTELESVRDQLCWDESGAPVPRPSASDVVPALCIKALFANGRVREAAVRLLAESRSPAALPVLALRSADWVPAVREAARDAILRRLDDDEDGIALTIAAPMAVLLAQRERGSRLAGQIIEKLARAPSGRAATALLTSTNHLLRRAAYQVLTTSGALDPEQTVLAALHDRDTVVRAYCAEHAARRAVIAKSEPPLQRLLTSKAPFVRIEAIIGLSYIGELSTIADSLPDRNRLVRDTARFLLRSHGLDFAEIYRTLLSHGEDLVTPGAVVGLGETGTAADVELINALLDHPRAKIRVAAIRALQALAPAIDLDRMLTLIENDPSPTVTRTATAAVIARTADIETGRLLALLDPARPVPVRSVTRKLLAARGNVWRLAVNARLLADPDEALARLARIDLKAAMRQQVYTNPSGEAAELLAARLPDADRLLGPADARLLRFIVGTAGPA